MELLAASWEYGVEHGEELFRAILDHLWMVGSAVGIALAVCFPAGTAAAGSRKLSSALMNFLAGIRVIPSLAILFLIVPALGLSTRSAVFALTVLAMPPIFLNTNAAFRTIDGAVLESARGLGMSEQGLFWQVKLPLALPVVLTGVRTAVVEVTASATLAAFVGSGGLGIYITRGFALYDLSILLVGAVPVALLTLILENLFSITQKIVSPPVHG